MKMKKKAIFFDFDYTLEDSTEGIVASVNFALKQLGYHEQETPAIKKTIGLSLEETYSTLTGKNSERESLLFCSTGRTMNKSGKCVKNIQHKVVKYCFAAYNN